MVGVDQWLQTGHDIVVVCVGGKLNSQNPSIGCIVPIRRPTISEDAGGR